MRTGAALLVTLLLAGCGEEAPADLTGWTDVGTPAELKYAIADAGGKPVMVKIWADW